RVVWVRCETPTGLRRTTCAGRLPARPIWARWAEAGFLFVSGLLLVLVLPLRRPRLSMPLLLLLVGLATGGSIALYHGRFLLFDAAMPAIGLRGGFTT